jgi:hypothetical protein
LATAPAENDFDRPIPYSQRTSGSPSVGRARKSSGLAEEIDWLSDRMDLGSVPVPQAVTAIVCQLTQLSSFNSLDLHQPTVASFGIAVALAHLHELLLHKSVA